MGAVPAWEVMVKLQLRLGSLSKGHNSGSVNAGCWFQSFLTDLSARRQQGGQSKDWDRRQAGGTPGPRFTFFYLTNSNTLTFSFFFIDLNIQGAPDDQVQPKHKRGLGGGAQGDQPQRDLPHLPPQPLRQDLPGGGRVLQQRPRHLLQEEDESEEEHSQPCV